MTNQVLHGDCLEKLKDLADNSVDAVVTDPPYGLSFMGKKWDYDVPSEDIWRECLRVLKPGGYLLAFAGTRTQHRMAVRIEDAGFEIRDMIAWVYGSGFPKSLNIGKAIDELQGNEREVVGNNGTRPIQTSGRINTESSAEGSFEREENAITKGNSEYEGWGTALKPALEPITVARKPLSEKTVALNVLKWGTGGINIDGSRVEGNSEFDDKRLNGNGDWSSDKMAKNVYEGGYSGERVGSSPLGRFPANFIHDGSDEVVSMFPNTKSGKANIGDGSGENTSNGIYGKKPSVITSNFADKGSASRFFYCAKASQQDGDEWLKEMPEVRTGIYDGNSGRSGQRTAGDGITPIPPSSGHNPHPTVKPTALMRYLCRLVTPRGGIVFDPFMGSGSTGKGAILEGFGFIGCDNDPGYVELARKRTIVQMGIGL